MSLNQSFISDFSEYYRWSQRTKIKYTVKTSEDCQPGPKGQWTAENVILQILGSFSLHKTFIW